MNTYYTAKDIEELFEKGVTQLEIGPNVFLTDFARETAEQLDIKLVQPGSQARKPSPAAPAAPQQISAGRYNKPRGCQHGANTRQAQTAPVVTQVPQSPAAKGDDTVNRLVDMVGKIIRRGD